jgi:hypothetical protein
MKGVYGLAKKAKKTVKRKARKPVKRARVPKLPGYAEPEVPGRDIPRPRGKPVGVEKPKSMSFLKGMFYKEEMEFKFNDFNMDKSRDDVERINGALSSINKNIRKSKTRL